MPLSFARSVNQSGALARGFSVLSLPDEAPPHATESSAIAIRAHFRTCAYVVIILSLERTRKGGPYQTGPPS